MLLSRVNKLGLIGSEGRRFSLAIEQLPPMSKKIPSVAGSAGYSIDKSMASINYKKVYQIHSSTLASDQDVSLAGFRRSLRAQYFIHHFMSRKKNECLRCLRDKSSRVLVELKTRNGAILGLRATMVIL